MIYSTTNKFLCTALIFSQINAFLVVPVQGMTIANFILMFFLFPVFFIIKPLGRERVIFFKFALVFSFFYVASQVSLLMVGNIESPMVPTVDGTGMIEVFKSTHFTQALYLLPGLVLALFVKRFFNKSLMNCFLLGQLLIAVIGILEVVYNFYSGGVFDILVNRSFRDGPASGEQYVNGVLRLKSLTGEASMYVFAVFPGFIVSLGLKRYKTAFVLLVSLILTFSSTFIVAALVFLALVISRSVCVLLKHKYTFSKYFVVIFSCVLLTSIALLFIEVIYVFFMDPLLKKLAMANVSGSERIGNIINGVEFAFSTPFFFFGVGFGTFRSTDFLVTLLLNVGLIGFLLVSYFVLFAAYKSYNNKVYFIGDSILVAYVMALMSVPEFSYLTPWFLIGASYSGDKIYRTLSDKFYCKGRFVDDN